MNFGKSAKIDSTQRRRIVEKKVSFPRTPHWGLLLKFTKQIFDRKQFVASFLTSSNHRWLGSVRWQMLLEMIHGKVDCAKEATPSIEVRHAANPSRRSTKGCVRVHDVFFFNF